jgi:hypothetical protein
MVLSSDLEADEAAIRCGKRAAKLPSTVHVSESRSAVLRYVTVSNHCRHSFISGLSPLYILAITETATIHQVPALKSAIHGHFRFRAAIGVHVSVSS